MTFFQEYKRIEHSLVENRQLEDDADPEMRELVKAEITELEARKSALEKELQLALVPKDPLDGKNIILEIRAGTGGDEAALFAMDLFRMYSRFAESKGWQVEILSSNETGGGGVKEVIALISGSKVYSFLKFESGAHRVQRVPATESQGRIHTSAVTVAILPEAEEVDVHIDPADLRIDVFRSFLTDGRRRLILYGLVVYGDVTSNLDVANGQIRRLHRPGKPVTANAQNSA